MYDSVVKEDEEHAFKLFEKAAERGHIAAKFMVADCLLNAVSYDLQSAGQASCSFLIFFFLTSLICARLARNAISRERFLCSTMLQKAVIVLLGNS